MGVVLRFGNQKEFQKAILAMAKRHHKRFTDKYRQKIFQLHRNLIAATPVDTGAAKGDDSGANRDLYKSHPAAYVPYLIGNEPGESGWQVIETVKDGNIVFSIANPMWDYYLKYVEFGQGRSSKHQGFIRAIWQDFKESL
jgi:hypothetical protein